ncbi:Uncharacterised protein [Vibrio cholerae]|nr:Uncharacterised protein [Vibrio cholerae]
MWLAEVTSTIRFCCTKAAAWRASSQVSLAVSSKIISDLGTPNAKATRAIIRAWLTSLPPA